MTGLRRRWRAWRCARDRHRHIEVYPAIWNGAYVQCRDCGRRDVRGGDRYGPAAVSWIVFGWVPPPSWPALIWGAAEWKRWKGGETDA